MPADELEDGIELISDGRMSIVIEGQTYKTRRIRLGELLKSMETIGDIEKQNAQVVKSVLDENGVIIDDKMDEFAAFQLRRQLDIAAWLKTLIETLTDKKLAAVEELPAWMGSNANVGAIMNHLTSAPFRPGAFALPPPEPQPQTPAL